MDDDKASLGHSISKHFHMSEDGHSNQSDLSDNCGEHSPGETSWQFATQTKTR